MTPIFCLNPPQTTRCPQAHFRIDNLEGFRDIGIQHPTGVVPAEARRFVCLAAARAVRKVTLQVGGWGGGGAWAGSAGWGAGGSEREEACLLL